MSNLGGTPFDWLFEKLTLEMGTPNITETSPTQRERVEWARSGPLGTEPCPYQLPRCVVLNRQLHPFTASIYAGSDLEVCALARLLEAKLEAVVGPKQGIDEVRTGYVFAAGKVEPRGGDGVAAGYGCDVAVTLRIVNNAERRPLAPPGPAKISAAALVPEALASTPITVAAPVPP